MITMDRAEPKTVAVPTEVTVAKRRLVSLHVTATSLDAVLGLYDANGDRVGDEHHGVRGDASAVLAAAEPAVATLLQAANKLAAGSVDP